MADILAVLAKNPYLEKLTLNDAIQPARAEVSRSHPEKILLDKLVLLDLSETIETINTLLIHLTLPSMLSWTITITETCRTTQPD